MAQWYVHAATVQESRRANTEKAYEMNDVAVRIKMDLTRSLLFDHRSGYHHLLRDRNGRYY